MSEVRYFNGNKYVNNLWAPVDIVSQGAYLRPSQSNAAVICQWMQKIAGTYGQTQGFMSNIFTSNSLSYSSSDTSGGYVGAVLQQNGTVFIWGANTNNAKLFNPKTGVATSYFPPGLGSNGRISGCLLPDGRSLAFPSVIGVDTLTLWDNTTLTGVSVSCGNFGIKGQLQGSCQMPDGRICLAPGNAVNGIANVIIFDQNTTTFSNAFSFSGAFGCITDVTGNVVFTPTTESAGVLIWNPETNARSKISISGMTDAFHGAAVVPDGRIVFGPWTQNHIGVYNPLTYSYTSYPTNLVAGTLNFAGPITLPNGWVLFTPFIANFFGLFNPYTNTYSSFSPPGIGPFTGGTVIPDGRIVLANNTGTTGVPILAGFNAPVPMEWCLHPFFNRGGYT